MCGILAHVAFEPEARLPEGQLRALTGLLIHRGPDSEGFYLKGDAALGVRRLSIIDLQGGDQPIVSEDGRYVIVFNGEIYNYEALRLNLLRKGYRLKTKTDTEVLLYSFIDQGPACLSALNGMFAFAIWDERNQELFVARDHLGIKPLYYTLDARRVMFCSELTPIDRSHLFTRRFNYHAISDYLSYWYICEPNTIFEGVYQLPPGTYAVIRRGEMRQERYWEVPSGGETPIGFNDAADELLVLLEDAVRLRMRVDVPIGTFLSGGIDSGLVTALAAQHFPGRLKAFAIGFAEKSYSELEAAGHTASRHGVELVRTRIDAVTPSTLEAMFQAFDEPLGNASFVPTYLLAQAAREQVKVVLTGDGGDELFGGYPTYQAPYYQAIYRKTPAFLTALAASGIRRLPVSHDRISLDYRLKQLMSGIALPYQRAHVSWREVTPLPLQAQLFREAIWERLAPYDPFSVAETYFEKAHALSVTNQLMFVDLQTYLLNDHLRKVDRMSMAHSLEARLPFLDHRLVEFAMRLPSAHKVTFFQTKKILKHAARGYLPKTVIHGPKRGLTAPIAAWLCAGLKTYVHDQLQGGLIEELFDRRTVQQILQEHDERRRDHSRLIWSLLALQGWSQQLTRVGCETTREGKKEA